MSLAVLTIRVGTPEELMKSVWEMMAFLGRYAHQPVSEMLRLPRSDLHRFSKGVEEFMRLEGDNGMREQAASGG